LETVISEFQILVESGYKEIVLTGVMIGNYRSGASDLSILLSRLIKVSGTFRVHLSSINPDSLCPELNELFQNEKVVKHLHLSLQSGSDRILKSMNRRYTGRDYIETIYAIRRIIPDFNFTTDLIVGFPGETDNDFDDSLAVIREAGFSHVHTFRYSPRPGTSAAEMDDVVPEMMKTERSRIVLEASVKQKKEYYSRFENRHSIIISENYKKGHTGGYNEYYVPVLVKGSLPRNEFREVITSYSPGKLTLDGVVCDGCTGDNAMGH